MNDVPSKFGFEATFSDGVKLRGASFNAATARVEIAMKRLLTGGNSSRELEVERLERIEEWDVLPDNEDAKDKVVFKNIRWNVKAVVFYPEPRKHSEFCELEKISQTVPYGVTNPEQLFALMQKNVDFMIAGTVRLEDRIRGTLLLAFTMAGLIAASVSWIAKGSDHSVQRFCIFTLMAVCLWLLKMHFVFGKPLYPSWNAWPSDASESFSENDFTENRIRIAGLVCKQHELIQRAISWQLGAVYTVMVVIVFCFAICLV